MLEYLKEQIYQETNKCSSDELLLEAVAMDDIKELFINSETVDENDPKLAQIIEDLPDDEIDDLENLVESAILEL